MMASMEVAAWINRDKGSSERPGRDPARQDKVQETEIRRATLGGVLQV